jgi:hypothetical protein
MLHKRRHTFVAGFVAGFMLVFVSSLAFVQARATFQAQDSAKGNAVDTPVYADFKGVHIGMTADEARQKLGAPQEKGDEQDFYSFNDKNTAQVYYDKSKKVYAVSVAYIGTDGAPAPKAIVGSEVETKPDGSMYKMVRYPKAGYWVSYSRTPGSDPLVTVTMQKLQP